MTKRTWLFTSVTTLLIVGLAACGGSGGGGGGSASIPTATNAAIAPPPTTPVTITTAGGGTTSPANQSIAANALQASDGATSSGLAASNLVTAQADNSGTEAKRETLAAIVRRHAEKLKDHEPSVTGALQVATQPCSGGGTATFAFDDASNSATEVFVTCNEGGIVTHGTITSSGVGVVQHLGSTVGSAYDVTVSASFAIDLSVTTLSPAQSVVTQGSFTFVVGFSGKMIADGTGGVRPDVPTRVAISINNATLLASDGTVRALLSIPNLTVDENDTAGTTTVTGGYTYASTVIGGSVTVTVSPTQPIVFQPQAAAHPSSGVITITSSGSPGKIVLTVLPASAGVRVDVFANASDLVATNTVNLTWTQADAL